jgi:hypothetical protein
MRELARDALVYGSWIIMGFAIFGLTVYIYNFALGANVLNMTGDRFLFGCLAAILLGEAMLVNICGNHMLGFLSVAGTASSPIIMATGIAGLFYPLGLDTITFLAMGVVVLILSALASALET